MEWYGMERLTLLLAFLMLHTMCSSAAFQMHLKVFTIVAGEAGALKVSDFCVTEKISKNLHQVHVKGERSGNEELLPVNR